MFKNLSAGMIGIQGLSLAEAIDLAQKSGFAGIDFDIREAAELADERGFDYVRSMFDDAGVRPGQWGLPVAWNRDDQLEQDLAQLPRLAELGRDLALFLIDKAVEEQATLLDSAYQGDQLQTLVVGGKGGMGSWMAAFLNGQGHRVSVFDPASGPCPFHEVSELTEAVRSAEEGRP